jgi:hypothetical protein
VQLRGRHPSQIRSVRVNVRQMFPFFAVHSD